MYYNWNLIEADSDDNKFVDCAVSANATGIVTQDKHFNVLRNIDYPNVNLISIADFKSSLCWNFIGFKQNKEDWLKLIYLNLRMESKLQAQLHSLLWSWKKASRKNKPATTLKFS